MIQQERVTRRLRSDIFSHAQRFLLRFYGQNRLGDLLRLVTVDAGRIMAVFATNLSELIINMVKFTDFTIVMQFINWRYSIIVLAYLPLLIFLFVAFQRNIRANAKAARKYEGKMANVALETMGAIREVKAFGQGARQQARFDAHGRGRVRVGMRATRWEASFRPVVDFVRAAGTTAFIWYGVSQILVGQLLPLPPQQLLYQRTHTIQMQFT